MTYYVLAKQKFTVAALDTMGADWKPLCRALEFLNKMHTDKNTCSSAKGYAALFQHIAENGPSSLSSSLLHEADKANAIMELIKGSLRLLCFIEGDTIYLTNGYLKNGQKADKVEVARAVQARKDFLTQNPARR